MKYLAAVSIFLLAGAWSAAATAQNCPQGLAGLPNCLPPTHPSSPHYQGAQGRPTQGSEPLVVWQHRYGAIAHAPGTSILGVAEKIPWARDAQKAALKDCKRQGGKGCRLLYEYEDGFGVLAMGKDQTGAWRVVGTSRWAEEDARTSAMDECSKILDACEIIYVGDSAAVRIR